MSRGNCGTQRDSGHGKGDSSEVNDKIKMRKRLVAENQGEARTTAKGLAGHIWRFFSSIRLAFFLIIILALLSLAGALISQIPSEYTASPELYRYWVSQVAQNIYGVWTSLLSFLRFFDIFHSPWFLAAGTLLMINILICSINRWKNIRRIVTGGEIKQSENFYLQGRNQAEIKGLKQPLPDAGRTIIEILKRRRYRVRTRKEGERIYIAADKNRYSRPGTYATHLSLILFVAGFIIGSFWGFEDNNFIVAEGETQPVGQNSGLLLRLTSFEDEYWSDGTPKDYRSEVVLYEENREVKRATVRVNHPLAYKGIRFYQSFYGPAVMLQIKNASGEVVYDKGLPLTQPQRDMNYQRYGGYIELPQYGVYFFIVSPARNGEDPVLKQGELAIQLADMNTGESISMNKLEQGAPLQLADFEVTYIEDTRFSGFQVKRDPGNSLIWIASGLFLLGMAMVLYVPYRQVWAVVISGQGGDSRLLLRMNESRSLSINSEFKDIIQKLKSQPSSTR